ncbi:MAG: DUF11 domain-containing protein [Pirellula sp.]
MSFNNKWLSRRNPTALVAIACLMGSLMGCQSRQLSWLGAQHSSRPSVEQTLDVFETPTALAHASPKTHKGAENSIASAVQPAVHSLPNSQVGQGTASHVSPAQYASPVAPVAPVASPVAAESVPRIAMAPTYVGPPGMAYGTSVAAHSNVSQPNVPRMQLASHTGGHAHGPNCGCKHGSGPYRPYFPRFSGNQGCNACGVASCSGECGGCSVTQPCAANGTDPQEFIFDGGDQDPTVRLRSDMSQAGLDPEDTVIQYETVDGKTSVESGCRVAIYAPRFAAVRKLQSTRESDLAMRLRTTLQPDGPGVIRDQLPSARVTQPLKSLNSDNVRVVEAIRDRNRPMPSEMMLPMVTISDAFKPYEDFSLIRNGDLKTTDLAKLARSTAAARGWTSVDEIHVLIDGKEAIELVDDKKAAEVTVYEHKGARIRLCKVASEQMANPGDTISFTIRFDNVGEQPLKNLVVTDSLAPRLEYIEKSQQSSVPTNFSLTSNAAGSSILRWELEDGLKPGDGGLVRFSCKVR